MHKVNKFWGSVLLIAGTSIGAGMLGLPVITGFAGFLPTIFLFIFFWGYMLITALLIVEVNMAFPGNINLITMAEKTLGFFGKAITWVVYLLLLYSLTAAYMAGSVPLFSLAVNFFFNVAMPAWVGPLPLIIIFGLFVYLGSRSVDLLNRILIAGLIIAFLILVVFLSNKVDINLLSHVDPKATFLAVTLALTSFGYHIIIPTLTNYLRHDIKKLRFAVIVGSIIPILIYCIWEFLVLGIVKISGESSLTQMFLAGEGSTKAVVGVLTNILKKPWIANVTNIFSFFAIITSFIGVTLSLADFLTDGFKLKRNKKGRLLACLLTFIPPLIFLYGYERVFLVALQYAGIFVAILLCILPALMAWQLKNNKFLKSFLGRSLLVFVIIIALIIIAIGVLEETGNLQGLLQKYLVRVD